jgi:hypothetical protein
MLATMSQYVAVLPLAPLELDDGFSMSAWPLHITIVPNFSSDLAPTAIGALFTPPPRAMDVVVGAEAMFGARENVRVALVEGSAVLHAAHRDLVSRVRASGALFDSPEYLDEGYRPHVTETKHARVRLHDRLHLAQLALVDMQPFGAAGLRRAVWVEALDDNLK